jgi:metal-responsive CopG/Arc/MetJ family transcriptional regulator
MSATETELIGVTLPKKWLKHIDSEIKDNPMRNRQDFIREAVFEKLSCKAEA